MEVVQILTKAYISFDGGWALDHLIKKAVSIRKHLERNRKDKDSKFRLILVERRIHRLARYYKKTSSYLFGSKTMQAANAKKPCTTTSKATKPKSSPLKDPQNVAAKKRRERISERLKTLQELVPNGSKVDFSN
ncbi:hypothetical protein ACSQ67_015035 [Phaseolus vulgaris]